VKDSLNLSKTRHLFCIICLPMICVSSHDSSVLWFKNPKEADIPMLKEKASKILELTSNQLVQDYVRQFQRTA